MWQKGRNRVPAFLLYWRCGWLGARMGVAGGWLQGGLWVAIGCLLLAYQMALWCLCGGFGRPSPWLYQDHGFSRRDCLSVRNQDSMPPVQVSRGTLAAIFRRFRID